MEEQGNHSYAFGRFSLDSAERLLLRDREAVPLTPKAFDILLTLVENNGRVVEKDELMKRVWPNTFVEEGNLTQNVSLLRKALGESANGIQFIETVPRRGYRFVAPVIETNGDLLHTHKTLQLPQTVGVQSDSNGSSGTFELNRTGFHPVNLLSRLKSRVSTVAFTLLAVLLAIGGMTYLSGRGKARAGASIESIAVLPFVDDSPDADAEFLDDEIAESLVNSLSRLPKLRVIPRSVMLSYKNQNADPRKVARDLNVRAIVTGRVHRHGDTISIQADLIDVDNVAQIWGQHYDRRLADILLVQEEISRAIVSALAGRIDAGAAHACQRLVDLA